MVTALASPRWPTIPARSKGVSRADARRLKKLLPNSRAPHSMRGEAPDRDPGVTGQYSCPERSRRMRPLLQKAAHPGEPQRGVSKDRSPAQSRDGSVRGTERRARDGAQAAKPRRSPRADRKGPKDKSRGVDEDQPGLMAAK